MGFRWMIVVLLQTSFTFLCSRIVVNDLVTTEESVKEDRENNSQTSHTIMSILSEDGDIIDCIDIYKQPAFDHPALKDHKIQMNPSHDVNTKTKTSGDESPAKLTTQTWRKSGSCPKGTIPVRRIQKSKVTKESDYGRKKATSFHYNRQLNDTKRLYLLKQNHSMSIIHADGYAYMGGKGDIKVWNPHVESDDEYSTSRVALKIGSQVDYEAIESGWQVNPGVYGDRQTRLYTYWTVDGSDKTGCFDLTCPGFVQTSNEIALGAAIYPISNPTGLPYQIIVYLHKDMSTSNWWVQYNEEINVGYWPAALFRRLNHHATTVQWGGEVYSPTGVGTSPHTTTAMGSGRFPDFVGQSSGYIKRMRVLENNNIFRFPQWTTIMSEEYYCYQTYYLSDYVPEPEFYYGGPGRNPMCP